MRNFTVLLKSQYPAYDERNGIRYHVEADTKADAIRRARRQARDDRHTGFGGKGRVSFMVAEVTP